ncbi:DNA polymerase III subunit alpha [Desulfogranum marinum]|uniref:DNA polymerase III subunit alpha n=1 Tax=Desulfogranum marinum TaxID=453220 RepID=UPI0029C8D9A0|nr:DNA polymerase III subunit alpha [Desulfogranum marinum]
MFPPSVALGVHSHYSMMEGTASMAELCRQARQIGYRTIAVTDMNNVYGLWTYLSACQEHGLRPIIGAEIRTRQGRFFCLVKNQDGFRNLCRLLTCYHNKQPFQPEQALEQYHQGLVILPTSISLLYHCHALGADTAAALVTKPDQHNSVLRRAAMGRSIPAVAVVDAFFLAPEDYKLHQLLRAINNNVSISRLSPRDTVGTDKYMPSPAAFAHRFSQWPEAMENVRLITEKCVFSRPSTQLVLPPCSHGDADTRLHQLAHEGAIKRYGSPLPAQVLSRLQHELQVIGDMHFSSYFLVVKDIVGSVARTCGRGSGAASLVAYCLFITNVCPVKHNLYFARFLNPGRSDPPDIDVDFSWDERDAILEGVLGEFGVHAAMVSNHVFLQPRMAIRETAKVFGLPGGEISRVTKKLPWMGRAHRLQNGFLPYLESLPQLRDVHFTGPWPRILAMAEKISGTPRHLSVHPGGVIITPEPISGYVPVEYAPKGVPIIQWEKDGAETAGLVKIDLLGNRSLGVIRDAIDNIRSHHEPFDEAGWQPEDDPLTQKSIAQGKTMGCFYIESPATRLLQKKARVGDFEHLVIHSSIIRPAANEFIREYLRRLHGGSWEPLHPLVGNVLDGSYGIMVYQEDVSRVAVQFGFNDSDADRLRKIMSKKDKQKKLADFKARFFAKAAERKVAEATATRIWKMMMSFDGYSFCKPHSASYAKVSFQAAYLKVHHPAEFMAAVISNQGGFYSTFAYVSEARRMGLTVVPPDVNTSPIDWTGRKERLQVGLMAVQGMSQKTLKALVARRAEHQFASVMDFLSRVEPAGDEALALIHCGALDTLEPHQGEQNRGALCWLLAKWQKNRKKRVLSLFTPSVRPPDLPKGDFLERLRNEYRVLGFLCGCHPIVLFDRHRRQQQTVYAQDIERYAASHQAQTRKPRIRFLGWMIAGKVVGTKKGDPMEFISFEDETGQVECTFFPKVYDRFCHLLHSKGPLLLEGYVDQEFGVCTLTVERVADRSTQFHLYPIGACRPR